MIMNISGKILIAGAVSIIVHQPETAHRVGGDQRCAVAEEVLVVHEKELVGIRGKLDVALKAGKFLNTRKLFFMDYQHFPGNCPQGRW